VYEADVEGRVPPGALEALRARTPTDDDPPISTPAERAS